MDTSKSTKEVDLEAANRVIQRDGLITSALLGVAVVAGYFASPMLFEFPADLVGRIAFALQASVFVLLWVLVGVFMVATGRRQSKEDIHGSAAGPPSDKLAVHVAFLQNSLEQAVLAAGLYLALATVLEARWMFLIVIAVIFFGVGRILFLWGYKRGAVGRSLGMNLTMLPTLLGYLLVIILLVSGWF